MPKGLYLRNGIYWARFKVKGIEYRESLHTRSEAKAVANLKIRREQVIQAVRFGATGPVSWQAAVVAWNEKGPRSLGIKPRTFDRYIVSLAQMDEWLGSKEVHEIDGRLLKEIVKMRQRRHVSNATIRRDMTAISSVLALCEDEGWIEDNPARLINRKRFKEAKPLIILPRSDSIARVYALGGRHIDLARFAELTGMREDEIVGLEHDRIDRSRRTVTLEYTKGNRVREVPISDAALAIIDAQPRHIKSRLVFWEGEGERIKNVPTRFSAKTKRLAQKAAREGFDFQRFRFHDLRHLFAVRYLREGRGSLYDLQQILGHSSVQTTERYLDHLTPDEKHTAMHGVAQNRAHNRRSGKKKVRENG